jgi:hypothetical protein
MTIAKDSTSTSDLREDFLYHATEARYHMAQYLASMEEVENHYIKFKEHASYRDEFQKRLWEESPCVI